MKFISPRWDEIFSHSITLAERLLESKNRRYDVIVGVSRGGLVLARVMSDLLCIQNVMITRCEYYSDLGETRRRPAITQKIQGRVRGKNVLLLDDVADTGESLLEIKKYLLSKRPANLTIATLYVKPWTKIFPDHYVASTSAWIVFPWELLEAIKSVSEKTGTSGLKKTGIPQRYVDRILPMVKSLESDSEAGGLGRKRHRS